jgi:hypothetical protein
MRVWIAAFAMVGTLFSAASSARASAPAGAGTVTGTLTANGKSVALHMAHARKSADGWLVLLSDAPRPSGEEASKLIEAGKLHLLWLTIEDGRIANWEMESSDIRGRSLQTSLVTSFKAVKLGPASVEASAKLAPEKFGDNIVAFDVTFKAPVQ